MALLCVLQLSIIENKKLKVHLASVWHLLLKMWHTVLVTEIMQKKKMIDNYAFHQTPVFIKQIPGLIIQ